MDTFKVTVSACRAVLSKEQKFLDLFESTFRDTIASEPMDQYLSSGCTISSRTNVLALQNACQTVSKALSDAHDPTDATTSSFLSLSTILWNPVMTAIVASLLQPQPAQPVLAKAGNLRPHAQANATIPSTSALKQAASSYAAAAKKKKQDTDKTFKPSFDASKVKKDLEDHLKSTDKHLFPTYTRCCGQRSCDRCVNIYRTLPLSSCRLHGIFPCVPSGWFPHLSGSLWSKISGAHNKAEVWKWSPPPVRDGQYQNPLSEISTRSSSSQSLEVPEALDGEEKNGDEVLPPPDDYLEFRPMSPTQPPTPPPQAKTAKANRGKRKGSPQTVRKGKRRQ